MSLIDDYKNGKRYGTDWQAPSFQHMNDLVGTVSDADDKADNALSKSTTAENNSSNALTKATTAETNSTNAVNTANTANSNSQAAVTTANNANTKSDQAISTANDADTKATNAETTVNNLTQPPDVSEANKFGVVNVEIIGTETNDEKFKFSNLKGNGIATIAKTGSNGLQDIYTITFDNGGTFSFNVTNGKGITNISKTNTNGLVDTYTITYNDESTSIFTITNGDSIELRVEDGYFQWKYTTSSTWNNLISLGELSNVDQELSETSTNAIANSAVTQALNNKSTITVNDIVQTTVNFDKDPQTQLDNMVTLNTEQTITAPKSTQLSINWTDNLDRSIALNKEIIVDNTNDHEITEKTTRHYEWNGSDGTGHVTWTDTQGSKQYKKEISLVSNTASDQYFYQTITQYGAFNLRSYYNNSTGSGTRYARFEFNSNEILIGYRNGSNNYNLEIDNNGINISSPDNNGLNINGAPIIESGSNANGYYTKFADGTLICYGNKTISNYAMTINYPAIFIDTNYSLVTQFVRDESLGNFSNAQGLNTLTTTSCVCYSAYSETATVLWIAIGRWK